MVLSLLQVHPLYKLNIDSESNTLVSAAFPGQTFSFWCCLATYDAKLPRGGAVCPLLPAGTFQDHCLSVIQGEVMQCGRTSQEN